MNLLADLKIKVEKYLEVNCQARRSGFSRIPLWDIYRLERMAAKDPQATYAFVSADTKSWHWRFQNLFKKTPWSHAGLAYFLGGHLWACHIRNGYFKHEHLLAVLKESDNFALLKLPFHRKTTVAYEALAQSLNEDGKKRKLFNEDIFKDLLQGEPFSVDTVYMSGQAIYQHVFRYGFALQDLMSKHEQE